VKEKLNVGLGNGRGKGGTSLRGKIIGATYRGIVNEKKKRVGVSPIE